MLSSIQNNSPIAWAVLLVAAFLASRSIAQEQAQEVDFYRDVKPILDKHCLECHGPDEQESGFRVDDRDVMLDEENVVPGDPVESWLYEVIVTDDEEILMPPPDEGEKLTSIEADVVKNWIEQGAKWPDLDPVAAAAVAQKTSETKKDADEGYWTTVWRAFGDLHPAVIHFPIALLLVGALFALVSFRGSYSCADFAFYCLWLGALGAIVSCFLGWSFAWNERHMEDPFEFDMNARLFWHRWTGIGVAVLAVLLALYASYSRYRDPDDGMVWKIGMLLLAGLVGYCGHAGGELTHGDYNRIYKLFGVFQEDEKGKIPVETSVENPDEAGGSDSPVNDTEQLEPADGDGQDPDNVFVRPFPRQLLRV